MAGRVDPGQVQPGDDFGAYKIVQPLGSGGMAEVFLARHRNPSGDLDRVVVKVIREEISNDRKFIKQFLSEARLMLRMRHPNVVRVYDVVDEGVQPCIVMEFLQGRDLWTVLRRVSTAESHLEPEEVAAIGMLAARGMHYAHRMTDSEGKPLNLVHRDITPQNLFLTRGGGVKVLDFGVAKTREQDTSLRTATGIIKGKLAYMSPEHARGQRELDQRADQFSLGVVLWECLTGVRLFARHDVGETVTAMFAKTPKPSSLTPVPEEIERVIMRMLSKRRTSRFRDCGEVATALESWLRFSGYQDPNALAARALDRWIPTSEDADFYENASAYDAEARQRINSIGPGDPVPMDERVLPTESDFESIDSSEFQDFDDISESKLRTTVMQKDRSSEDYVASLAPPIREASDPRLPRDRSKDAPSSVLKGVLVAALVGISLGAAIGGVYYFFLRDSGPASHSSPD